MQTCYALSSKINHLAASYLPNPRRSAKLNREPARPHSLSAMRFPSKPENGDFFRSPLKAIPSQARRREGIETGRAANRRVCYPADAALLVRIPWDYTLRPFASVPLPFTPVRLRKGAVRLDFEGKPLRSGRRGRYSGHAADQEDRLSSKDVGMTVPTPGHQHTHFIVE